MEMTGRKDADGLVYDGVSGPAISGPTVARR